MHLEDGVLFSDLSNNWLQFDLKTPESHTKDDVIMWQIPPGPSFPANVLFLIIGDISLIFPETTSKASR